MSIISRFANRFLKSRVISNSLNCERLMVEMCKGEYNCPEELFVQTNAMGYYECRFYSHIARKWNINVEPYEQAQYQLAKKRFEEFEDLYRVINGFQQLHWEYNALYQEITREISSHNCWSRTENTSMTFEHSLEASINKYVHMLKELEPYPEWQEKFKEEVGYYIHMIYNTTQFSDKSKEIFGKFDKHYYFK